MAQYVHSGNAPDTTLASDVTAGATTITVASATGWPSPSGGKLAWGVLAPGTSAEEKFTYSGKSGDSLTGVTRGQDGTTAAAHTAGVTVRHVFSAVEATAATDHINATASAHAASAISNTPAGNIAASTVQAALNELDTDKLAVADHDARDHSAALATASIDDLADVDFTGIAAGSIVYWNGSSLIDLAIGTAGQALKVNSGATAPEWGTGATQDLEALAQSVATTEVVSSTTETNIASATITGGSLSAGDVLRLVIVGDYLNNSGVSANLTIRVKLGATTILNTSAMAMAENASRRNFRIEVLVFVESGTAQRTWAEWMGTIAGSGMLSQYDETTTGHGNFRHGYGTATEDTSTDKTLAVSAQHGTSSANISIRAHAWKLERIAAA